MRVVHTAAELAELTPASGKKRKTRAVVMTMGALHEGHLALVRAAAEAADQVVVTIFVNPLQFDDGADLERYPRDLDADCTLLEPLGVDVVFAPDVTEMYPTGDPIVTVSAGAIGTVFEGAFRPGHFDGVLTAVLKLLHLTRADVAVFGQKDAQQVIAIKAMCRELIEPVDIIVVPTVREEDGLALSSRNAFLSADERSEALALSHVLDEANQVLEEGGRIALAVAVGRAALEEAPGVLADYIGALDPITAQPVPDNYQGDVIIAVAAHVGQTRLIDNVVTRVGPRAAEAKEDDKKDVSTTGASTTSASTTSAPKKDDA